MSIYTVAHSPDADDIFMYAACEFGWLGIQNLGFKANALDIETLNVEALKSTYDITAISFALYPNIANEYALLSTAASFGNGYGPKLVKKKGATLKKHFKLALSGKNTTNAMLARIAYPNAKISYMNFLEIEEAVREGTVDAGVLIHEAILTYGDDLEVEREIWDIWQELGGEGLPLPLGGMAIRRSIPLLRAIEIENMLTKAIEVAQKNSPLISKMLHERNKLRISAEKLEKYLSLYANDASVKLDKQSFKALNKLYEIGYNHKEYSAPLDATKFVIPTYYEELRKG